VTIAVLVQARVGSSRLPNKTLLPLTNKDGTSQASIAHTVHRAAAVGVPVFGVVPECDLEALSPPMTEAGCGLVWSGPEEDVLTRFSGVIRYHKRYDTIVRVTGDCPLWAPDIARGVIQLYDKGGYDYVSNDTLESGYPDGTDVEVFSRRMLIEANKHATDAADREHVTTWIRRNTECGVLQSRADYSGLKLSVDTREDYERVASVMAYVRDGQYGFAHTVQACARAGLMRGAGVMVS